MKTLDWIGITFVLVCIVFCSFGFLRIKTNTEDVLQWLPDQSEARRTYNFFEARFSSDDFLIVTWEGCTIDDPRLTDFSQMLHELDHGQLLQSCVNGLDIIERVRNDLKIPPAKIKRRLAGVFFGLENQDITCTLIELSPEGTRRRTDAMKLVWTAVDEVPGLEREQIQIGGYPYIATFIDQQLSQSYRLLLLPSVVLATLVALFCFRNIRLTLIVFFTALGAASVSVAFIPVCGMAMGGLMSIIPALVFVLATSGSIHLIRYSLTAIGEPRKLLSIGWKPCTISAATTAVGMMSLTRSDFPAIRNFGFFCATGVGFALAFQLVMVPWLLDRFGQNGLTALAAQKTKSGFWIGLIRRVEQFRWFIVVVSLIAIGLGIAGVTRLTAQVEVEKLFHADSSIIRSFFEMENSFGPMDQTEVLLVFNEVNPESFPDRVRYVRLLQQSLARLPQIDVAYSLTNFMPDEPTKSGAASFAKRQSYGNVLRKQRENMANSDFLFLADNEETWRISLRLPFTKENDFGELADDVNKIAAAVAVASELTTDDLKLSDLSSTDSTINGSPKNQTPTMIYTGKTHLFYHAQKNLLNDLFWNFMLAFIIITPMLILVLRSLRLGLVAMIPNLFPTLLVFGGLGWLGIPVDLAIAMTACVALGIAVDDTTHFLVRFREYGGGLERVSIPIDKTISQCGPAMLHTTLIACAGLMVYYFSDMLVVSKFAVAISTLLAFALLADVFMLPAILFLLGRKGD